MKKRVSLAVTVMLIAAAALMAAGCADNVPEPTPTPVQTADMTQPPKTEAPVTEEMPGNQPVPGEGKVIEGFVEGAMIELTRLPENIVEAIRRQYADATIKSASYATYENRQMYKVTVQRAEDDITEDIYVAADGSIVPAKATAASPSPAAEEPAAGVESGK